METCDKNHIPVRVGDVLKVFHYTGARRKKHYMYKHVIGTQWLGGYGNKPKVLYFKVSHLNLKPFNDNDGGYWLCTFDGILDGCEIIQSAKCDHEDRPKVSAHTHRGAKGAAMERT